MTSFDAFSPNVESNLALGYMMAAQLHIRSKDKDMKGNLTSASDMIDTALGEQSCCHPRYLSAPSPTPYYHNLDFNVYIHMGCRLASPVLEDCFWIAPRNTLQVSWPFIHIVLCVGKLNVLHRAGVV